MVWFGQILLLPFFYHPIYMIIEFEADILSLPQISRNNTNSIIAACEEGPGVCSLLLTVVSFIMIVATLPFSLLYTIKVVQEYERAVIFRLGRLLSGGARGPGVFFIIPCVDVYEKIDLRTATYEIPPQEVCKYFLMEKL